jgi:hypothetical protein
MVLEYHILSETTGWMMLPLICLPKFLYRTRQLQEPGWRSRYSDSLRPGRSGDRIPVRRDFPHLSRPASGPTRPPVQWVQGLSREKGRAGRDADHTPSAEVKKELSYTSTHPMGPPGPVMGFPLPLPLPLLVNYTNKKASK